MEGSFKTNNNMSKQIVWTYGIMEALKTIKIIGNQNDGNASKYRVTKSLNFMRDPKLAHILVLIPSDSL